MGRTVDEGKWAEWRRRLARHGEWVGSVAAFCEREGVSVAAFYQWRRKLGRKSHGPAAPRIAERPAPDSPPRFLPVRIEAPEPVEIELPNGVRVLVPLGSGRTLAGVLAAAARCDVGASAEEVRAC